MTTTPRSRDAELLERVRAAGLPLWLPAELFPGAAVPFWAVNAIQRLVDANVLERLATGRGQWKYRLVG